MPDTCNDRKTIDARITFYDGDLGNTNEQEEHHE